MAGPSEAGSWKAAALTAAALIAAGVAVSATPALRDAVGDAISGDHEAVRDDLSGASGVLLVIALAAIHSVLFYPAEILDAAVGFVYGFWGGLALVMACWVMNALISYGIGRNAARPLLYRLGGRHRFELAERTVARGGVTLLLSMRLIPIVPFSLFSIGAGAARVPIWTFIWTTALGYLPLTAYFVYLGTKLEGFHLDDPILWAGALGLLLGVLGARRLAPGQSRK